MLNIGTKQCKLKRVIRRLDLKAASLAKGLQKTKKGEGSLATKRCEAVQGPLRTKPGMREGCLHSSLPAHACYQVFTMRHAGES